MIRIKFTTQTQIHTSKRKKHRKRSTESVIQGGVASLTLGSKTWMRAASSRRSRQTKAEADSRVSPVSFLNANPKTQIFFEVMVLNMRLTYGNTRFTK